MSDDVDDAQAISDLFLANSIAAARGGLEPGVPGECPECGEDSLRLVENKCASCRDIETKYSKLRGR